METKVLEKVRVVQEEGKSGKGEHVDGLGLEEKGLGEAECGEHQYGAADGGAESGEGHVGKQGHENESGTEMACKEVPAHAGEDKVEE